MVRERDIERMLVERIEKLGGLCLKWVSPGRRNVPDRIVLLPGGMINFVEVKAPGKIPSVGQMREHQRLRNLGFCVYLIDSEFNINCIYPL